MSGTNGKDGKSVPVFSRKIGAGLSRINLSPGLRETSQRGLGRESTLSTPSKVIVSGNSLGGSRITSDRYTSGYNRLGGYKNSSSPNVSYGSSDRVEKESTKAEVDINQNDSGQLRKNLSATNTLELVNNDSLISTVQRSQSANRGYNVQSYGHKASTIGATGALSVAKQPDSANYTRSTSDYMYTGRTQGNNVKQYSESYNITPSVNKTKVDNYNLDLEEDEEDVCLTPIKVTADTCQRLTPVKDTYDGSQHMNVEVTSPQSPSKDSGYHSPRSTTDVDTFITSSQVKVTSRSPEVTEMSGMKSEKINLEKLPERPVRSKSLSRKRVTEQFKQYNQLESSPRQPEGERSTVSGNVSTGKSESELFQDTVRCGNLYSDMKVNSEQSVKSPVDCMKHSDVNITENVPVARPRSHRRLTKRSISFKKLEDDEYIGFASLPEQVHRKAVRRGFEFTLMVVGETGLGKSTLINSLFLMDLYKERKMTNTEERIQKTVELEKKELEIEERGVKLKLTIVDTPGFNDAVNAEESWKPIVNYIDSQFNAYFMAESGLNRKNIQDTRVHCCLYFISPYGHGLRPADIMVMKKLHHKVNIIPLIAKSDMLTKQEKKKLKEKVLSEIQKHNIHIYQYPDCDSDEDEEFKQQDVELKKSIPFAVVGSNTVVEAGGKKIRGRMYPWGIVEVENPQHSDFIKLRQMLISTHMQDLKDVTCDVHYENYRAEHISEQMTTGQRERGKLKRDSVANMEQAVETEKLLQEKEAEIKRMQEMLAKMQAQLNGNSPRVNGRVGHV